VLWGLRRLASAAALVIFPSTRCMSSVFALNRSSLLSSAAHSQIFNLNFMTCSNKIVLFSYLPINKLVLFSFTKCIFFSEQLPPSQPAKYVQQEP
jgi:hypothetical protein